MKKNTNKEFTAAFLYYDQQNMNGRIYSEECAESIVNQIKDIQKTDRPVLGEYGNPSRMEIGMCNVSHEVIDVHVDKETKSIIGTIRLLDTPVGKKVLEALESNSPFTNFDNRFVVRSRGTGKIDPSGYITDYTLFSFDIIEKEDDAFKNITDDFHV